MTILELHKRFNTWNSARVFVRIVTQTDDRIVELNRDQLELGFNKKKQRLTLYASLRYALRKNAMNSKAGLWNPDLKLSGKFHEKINAKADETIIKIESSDSKSIHLEKKYGSDIFGLTDDRLNEYIREVFYPLLMQLLRQLLK